MYNHQNPMVKKPNGFLLSASLAACHFSCDEAALWTNLLVSLSIRQHF